MIGRTGYRAHEQSFFFGDARHAYCTVGSIYRPDLDMDITAFANQFAEAIEIAPEQISGMTEFKQLGVWDSLCVLTVIAMIDTNYGVSVGGNDIERSRTVNDLFDTVALRVR
jgi:acyl carrier protein